MEGTAAVAGVEVGTGVVAGEGTGLRSVSASAGIIRRTTATLILLITHTTRPIPTDMHRLLYTLLFRLGTLLSRPREIRLQLREM